MKNKILKELGTFQKMNNEKNVSILYFENGRLLNHFDSVIAISFYDEAPNFSNKVFLTNHHDYSRTTAKIRNEFLGYSNNIVKDKITANVYKVIDFY